jgi:non-heme chloroperoxidase
MKNYQSFITEDQVTLAYTDEGSGPPLVFLSGWRMSSIWWSHQVQEFKRKFRVITIDMRGTGESEKQEKGYRLSRYAKDVHELLVEKELDNVNLIGWSLGASVIYSYIDQYGNNLLKSCVLIEQTPKCLNDSEWHLGLGHGTFDANQMALRENAIRTNDKSYIEELCQSIFFQKQENIEELKLRNWAKNDAEKMPSDFALKLVKDHWKQDWREVLGLIDRPTLIVYGGKSKFFHAQIGNYLKGSIIDAELKQIKNSGHAPFIENPDVFNKVLTDFLNKTELS